MNPFDVVLLVLILSPHIFFFYQTQVGVSLNSAVLKLGGVVLKLLSLFVIFVLTCFITQNVSSFFFNHFKLLLVVLNREVKLLFFVVTVVGKVRFKSISSILQDFYWSCKVNFALEEFFRRYLV